MVIAAAAALAGSALAANPDEEFEFMSNGSGEYTLQFYHGQDDAVVIPGTHMEEGDEKPLPVTEIAAGAFEGSGLLELTIPGEVKTIAENAFEGQKSLMSVTFLDYVSGAAGTTIVPNRTVIGAKAFKDCAALTTVTFSGSIGEIGESAFSGCASLSHVVIPGNVVTVKSGAFSGCTGLKYFDFPGTAVTFESNVFPQKTVNSKTVLVPEIIHCRDNATYAGLCAKYPALEEKVHLIENYTETPAPASSQACKNFGTVSVSFTCMVSVTTENDDGTTTSSKEPCSYYQVDSNGGYTDSGTRKVSPGPHTVTTIDAKPGSTCGETGFGEGKKCSVCDYVLIKPEEIPTEHQYETAPFDADQYAQDTDYQKKFKEYALAYGICSAGGMKGYRRVCSACGEVEICQICSVHE